jgi:hypothetical protein
MLLAEIRYRIKDRFFSLLNDDRKFVKLISRLGFLSLFAAIIVVVAPTSAEETTAQPEQAPVEIVETITAVVDTSTPTPYASPISVDTSTIGESLTALSVKETTTPLSVQPKFVIKTPSSLTIDPRATTKFIPTFSISGSEYVLVCINGDRVNLDISNKKVNSDGTENGHIIVGDMTSTLLISGKTSEVSSLINSVNGLLVYSTSGGVAERSISIELVAMTNPGVKRSFCESAKSISTINFRSMGLDMGTVKSGITLK